MTPGGWLRRAEEMAARSRAAYGQVASGARDEALFLILRTLGLSLDSPAVVMRRRLTAAQSSAVGEALRRRFTDREPAAYIAGEAWLGGLRFLVDERVLIPRSYFVEILEDQVNPWVGDPSRVARAVDVCTGSGCLAVLLARHFKRARVDATDLMAGALEVAAANVGLHGLSRRVRLLKGDLLLPAGDARYDVILSNPPYEPSARVDRLPREFRREPRVALDGGSDGLRIVRRLVRQAATRLAPGGILMIEVGGCREAFEREFGRLEPHWFHTHDGSDCVCLIQAERLARRQGRARS